MEIITYTTVFNEKMTQIIIPTKYKNRNQIINKIEELDIKGFTNINNNNIYLNVINSETKKYNFTKFINWVCKINSTHR